MADDTKFEMTEEKVQKWIRGEVTLRELEGVSEQDFHGLAAVGASLLEQGKLDQALEMYEGLAALDPRIAYVHSTLGAIYMRQNRPVDALGEFNQAIQLDPKDSRALCNRGELLLRTGLLQEAAGDFRRCIELDPDGRDPAAMRARALVMVVRDLLSSVAAGTGAKA